MTHRRSLTVLAVLTACVAVAALPAGAVAAGQRCRADVPTAIKFHREAGKPAGRLSWHAPRGARAGTRYRVYRSGAVIGQTAGRSMRVRAKPGRRYVFRVRVVRSSGRAVPCGGQLTRMLGFRVPSPPRRLAARRVARHRILLDWLRSRAGDAPLAGYRVLRNGITYRQIRHRRVRVRVATTRAYVFRVAAVDTRGNLSSPSAPVRVRSRHRAPGRPGRPAAGRITDSTVGLSWSRARSGSSPLAGYRIYRDGSPLRQVRSRAAEVINLAAATTYRFSVAAVDKQGITGPAVSALPVTTALPSPTEGRAHAFLLASTGESFRDFQRHYRQIGTVYPTYFECRGSDAAVLGAEDPLVTRWAQLRRVQVMPRFDCQRAQTLHLMLTDPATRAATINSLVNLVSTYGYDGINLDFESGYATDRDALTEFVAAVAARLHPLGKKVAVEVSAKDRPTTTGRSGFYGYPALAAYADYVYVMNWGFHWSTSAPGAPDDLGSASRVANYVASMSQKQKFVLGTPFYGMDWPDGGGSSNPATPLEYADLQALMARFNAVPAYDSQQDSWHFEYSDAGVWHEVWFATSATVANRIRLAADRGIGIGFWRLGLEDQGIWGNPSLGPGAAWPN